MPKVIFLDQNKWIQLCNRNSSESIELYALLMEKVSNKEVKILLSNSNILETFKIYDSDKRHRLSQIQCELSQGWVFLDGNSIQRREISNFIARKIGKDPVYGDGLFCSDVFWDAFGGGIESNIARANVSKSKGYALYHYLNFWSEKERRNIVEEHSKITKNAVQKMKSRTDVSLSEAIGLQRRIYKATVTYSNQDVFFEALEDFNVSITDKELLLKLCKEAFEDSLVLQAETELALKIENQNGKITENDTRDMASFSKALPYADLIVGERQFVSFAKQCALPWLEKGNLLTKLSDLKNRI